MKVNNARICIDCDEVFSDEHKTCPACTSGVMIYLANWLAPLPTRDELEREMKSQALCHEVDELLLKATRLINFNGEAEPLGAC